MELRRYLKLFGRWWALVLVATVVGCLAGYASTSHTDRYRASAELYIGHRQPEQDNVQMDEINSFNQILQTYAAMIPSEVFAEKAVAATSVPRTAGAVVSETSASVVTNTDLITVSVTDTDPRVAQKLANGISTAFVTQVQSSSSAPPTQTGVVPQEPAYVFQTAGTPSSPVPNGGKRKLILGAVFGFVIGVILVFLIDYLLRQAAVAEPPTAPSGAGVTGGAAGADATRDREIDPADDGLAEDQPRSRR